MAFPNRWLKGDEVSLWIELPADIPRDTLLGNREKQSSVKTILTVLRILPDRSGVGRLELNPSQQLPWMAFVNWTPCKMELGLHQHLIRMRSERKSSPSPPA